MSQQKPSVAILHYTAPPVVGGVESVLGQHARLLVQAGFPVQIIAGRGEELDPKIPFLCIPQADSRHPQVLEVKADLDQGIVSPKFAELTEALTSGLRDNLKDTRILIVHNVCSLNKNLALTAALKNLNESPGSPHLILWHHDLAWTTPRYRLELHEGYPWNLLCSDWPGAVQVVVSKLRQKELAELLNIPAERIHVIPNGVNIGQFMKLENETYGWMNKLALLAAEPLLLLPVRITPRKNIELAVRALSVLCEEFPNAKLLVTGPLGPHNPANLKYFEWLVHLRDELDLNGAVWFLAELTAEFLPDAVIADFYHLADALILPSREEGFGIPLLEAGLAGIPVFCTDLPPLRDLGGQNVAYFSADADPKEVASLLANSLKTSSTFKLRLQVKQSFSWERIFSERIFPLLITQSGVP
jgi:glycosyltransferase involved in cell wall biosynthesis